MSAAPGVASGDRHLVHGLDRDLVAADWPELADEEVRDVLSRVDLVERAASSDDVHVTWSSPRPMSAASLVACASGEYFVKRHHVSVRSPDRLRVEHSFARHLHDRGLLVPRAVAASDGDTVVRSGDFVYEVHEKASGLDPLSRRALVVPVQVSRPRTRGGSHPGSFPRSSPQLRGGRQLTGGPH